MEGAKKVYEMGNNPKHPRYKDCVQLHNLEENTLIYQKEKMNKKQKKSNDIEL